MLFSLIEITLLKIINHNKINIYNDKMSYLYM